MSEEAQKGTRVRVERELGDCDYCDATNLQVIGAFDESIYPGLACPKCVLSGETNSTYPPDHRAMSPMVFVAKALTGVQPYERLLRAADAQKADERKKAQVISLDQERKRLKRLRDRGVVKTGSATAKPNRKQRRAARAVSKKGKKR